MGKEKKKQWWQQITAPTSHGSFIYTYIRFTAQSESQILTSSGECQFCKITFQSKKGIFSDFSGSFRTLLSYSSIGWIRCTKNHVSEERFGFKIWFIFSVFNADVSMQAFSLNQIQFKILHVTLHIFCTKLWSLAIIMVLCEQFHQETIAQPRLIITTSLK